MTEAKRLDIRDLGVPQPLPNTATTPGQPAFGLPPTAPQQVQKPCAGSKAGSLHACGHPRQGAIVVLRHRTEEKASTGRDVGTNEDQLTTSVADRVSIGVTSPQGSICRPTVYTGRPTWTEDSSRVVVRIWCQQCQSVQVPRIDDLRPRTLNGR